MALKAIFSSLFWFSFSSGLASARYEVQENEFMNVLSTSVLSATFNVDLVVVVWLVFAWIVGEGGATGSTFTCVGLKA